MNLKNFDIRHMPIWTHGIVNELEELCWNELKQECVPYNQILEERDALLNKYPVLSRIDDGGKITEPITLNLSESKALSEYLTLDGHRGDMEKFQMYLLGFRHMMNWLELIKVI